MSTSLLYQLRVYVLVNPLLCQCHLVSNQNSHESDNLFFFFFWGNMKVRILMSRRFIYYEKVNQNMLVSTECNMRVFRLPIYVNFRNSYALLCSYSKLFQNFVQLLEFPLICKRLQDKTTNFKISYTLVYRSTKKHRLQCNHSHVNNLGKMLRKPCSNKLKHNYFNRPLFWLPKFRRKPDSHILFSKLTIPF